MSDDEKIYGEIWSSPSEDFIDIIKLHPPPNNGSLRTNISETDDGLSSSCKSFEGESVDDLDIPIFKPNLSVRNEKSNSSRSQKSTVLPFPKKPCFSELDPNDKLEYHGPIVQLVHKLTTSKKQRYAVLISNRLILFEKPEHKVSKTQIPLASVTGIDWADNANCANKNDCNKFKLETPLRSYKFQCPSHESAGLWLNHIGKLVFDKQNSADSGQQGCVLKANVALENVKGRRIFTVEARFTMAYYESEEDFRWGIAMHRIQLRTSGVKRDRVDANALTLITSYRKYRLTFESGAVCNDWFQALSTIIHTAISTTLCSTDARTGDEVLAALGENPSNRLCVECGSTDVQWASVNLLVTLCARCAGLHRGLGPSVSKVQGIFTDEARWEDAELVQLFQLIGNDGANAFWMANCDERGDAATVDQRFVTDKYARKRFIERREVVFERYRDQAALNDELVASVRCGDVARTMRLFHVGAELGEAVLAAANENGQALQLAFLRHQSQSRVKDWRGELFECDTGCYDDNEDDNCQERLLLVAINGGQPEERLVLARRDGVQLLDGGRREVARLLFRNVCLVHERSAGRDAISLVVVVRDTELSQPPNATVDTVEFSCADADMAPSDLRDFKNVVGQHMFPGFVPTGAFECAAWVIVSTVGEQWSPRLLLLNCSSVADLLEPGAATVALSLDLRKVGKLEELRDNNYETACPYATYNLASTCLMMAGGVIHHVRADTRQAHDELLRALERSWLARSPDVLADQFLTRGDVPLPVYQMVRYLQVHGTQVEGLFRRVGSVREAERLVQQLRAHPTAFVLANCEPHDVASALKLFLRRLRDPLLTRQLYRDWMAAADHRGNSADKLRCYKQVVAALPPVNYETLRLLIFLLVNVDKNGDVTQMNPDTLGTSFNTCLLISAADDMLAGAPGAPPAGFSARHLQVLPYLIRNYQFLFDVTQDELEIEEKYAKERKKIRDVPVAESSLLRQIHIEPALEGYLKRDVAFEREAALLSKQLRIEQATTGAALLRRLFEEEAAAVAAGSVVVFEDRLVDELRMHRLVYPQQNLFDLIRASEQVAVAASASRKWIFKLNRHELSGGGSAARRVFRCWASLSPGGSSKNKVFVELSTAGQLNVWRSDACAELLTGLSTRGLALFRSCEPDRFVVAFEERKTTAAASGNSAASSSSSSSSSPASNLQTSLLNLIASFKPRSSSFVFISFPSKLNYLHFLQAYDQWKLLEFTPRDELDARRQTIAQ